MKKLSDIKIGCDLVNLSTGATKEIIVSLEDLRDVKYHSLDGYAGIVANNEWPGIGSNWDIFIHNEDYDIYREWFNLCQQDKNCLYRTGMTLGGYKDDVKHRLEFIEEKFGAGLDEYVKKAIEDSIGLLDELFEVVKEKIL